MRSGIDPTGKGDGAFEAQIEIARRNTPLRGMKATTWEGGTRVPAILKWPGRLKAGSKSTQVADWQRKPHYLIGRRQGPETLYRLIFEPDVCTTYMAYPMTHIEDEEALWRLLASGRSAVPKAMRR